MALGAEDRLHDWLRRRLQRSGFDRVGDDGAILPRGGPWAVTMDHQIAGVHFPENLSLPLVARRLLAVNLSDLAAMGAQPAYAFLALSCSTESDSRRFLDALLTACRRYDLELAGGDLAHSDRLAAVLTLLGRRTPGGRWLRRAGASADDRLWVGGALGLSALGRELVERGAAVKGRQVELPRQLRLPSKHDRLARRAVRLHLVPQPQLELGSWLARRRRAAAIDVSDGLAIDLHRLCRESAVGAELQASQLPVERGFRELCRAVGLDADQLVLAGGEDYALIFALSPALEPPSRFRCRVIGRLVSEQRLRLIDARGHRPLPAAGWDHFGTPA